MIEQHSIVVTPKGLGTVTRANDHSVWLTLFNERRDCWLMHRSEVTDTGLKSIETAPRDGDEIVFVEYNSDRQTEELCVPGYWSECADQGGPHSVEGFAQSDGGYLIAPEDYTGWRLVTRKDAIEIDRSRNADEERIEKARARLGTMPKVRKSLAARRFLPTEPGEYLDNVGDRWTVRLDGKVDLVYAQSRGKVQGLDHSSASPVWGPYTRVK